MKLTELSDRQVGQLRAAAVIAFVRAAFAILQFFEFISSFLAGALIAFLIAATAIVGGVYALRREARPALWFLLASTLLNIFGVVVGVLVTGLVGLFEVVLFPIFSLTAFILVMIVSRDSSRSVVGTANGGANPVGVAVPNEDGSIPEGWYADPDGKPADRFWDGTGWTDKSRPQTTAVANAMVAGARKPTVTATGEPISPQSRAVAALLCWFLGVIGIHRFYVGKAGTGVAQIFTLGGLGVWALVDFIMILAGSFTDKQERVLVNW